MATPLNDAEIIKRAIKLAWGDNIPPELIDQTDDALRDFYRQEQNKRLLAGAITSAITERYDIGNPKVEIPEPLQKLFMDAESVLSETAARKIEREDQLMSQSKETR